MTAFRDRQYEPEHRASLARKAQPPKNLLGWFLEAFRAEIPGRIHSADVWRDRVSPDEERQGIGAVGGSLLGSPRTADAFRRYVEERPDGTQYGEYEGHKDTWPSYATPMRAALARLAGRQRDAHSLMARHLLNVARRDGDWNGACSDVVVYTKDDDGVVIVDEEASTALRWIYVNEALRRLYIKYQDEPEARSVRTIAGITGSGTSDAERAGAIVASAIHSKDMWVDTSTTVRVNVRKPDAA